MTQITIGNKTILSPEEIAVIVYDLQIHQLELEMQNEELRNTQLILEEAQSKYSKLYNSAPVGYITFDEKGIIREANLTIANLMNTEKCSLIDRPVSDFTFPEYQDALYNHRQQLKKSKTRVCCELQLRKANGEQFWAGIESIAVATPDGVNTGFQCAISDISERKRGQEALLRAHEELEQRVAQRTEALRAVNEALTHEISERKRSENERLTLERQVLQAQKMESLGVLAGGIAHDFNNLLIGIIGYADLTLLLSKSSPQKAESYIKKIKETALCLSDLTKQMLAYSGRGRFVVHPINITQIVLEIQKILNLPFSKKITVEYDLSAGLPFMEGDRNQQHQIVMNLITNAAEAIGDQVGLISVKTGIMEASCDYLSSAVVGDDLPAGRYIYLQVSDTGCGMDQETQSRIFEPFFTTKFSGRGLGLAAVLGIIRGHKGAIIVESRPGQGTTFRVLYPCAECGRPPHERQQIPKTTYIRDISTVLLVDDEELVRNVGAKMLDRMGVEVLVAQTGDEALDIYREKADKIDCVLLDLSMPGMSGEAIFQELRRVKDDVCIILSSGFSEYELKERFGGKGLAGFLPKPYDFEMLAHKLETVLSHHRIVKG